MKKGLRIILKVFVAIPGVGVGAAWMLSHDPGSLFFKLACMLMAFGAALVWQVGTKYTKWILSLSILMWAYPLGELVWYLKTPPQQVTGYNKACAEPDSIRGYRWTANEIRYFKTAAGETVFDNYFRTNNHGWVMRQDYEYRKPDIGTKRWMLLGDSFSTGIMLQTNVADRIQKSMNADSLWDAQIYSFAVDGGGIVNWYQTFFGEIVPEYEFDGIVLAVYEDNLYRDLMVQQVVPGKSFLGRTDLLDWSAGVPDFANASGFDKRRQVFSDDEINHVLQNPPRKSFDWPLKNWLYQMIKQPEATHRQKRIPANSIERLKQKLGSLKFNMLSEMLTWCMENDKQVILASVPSRKLLADRQSGRQNWHQQEMGIISTHWIIPYFDGYSVYSGEATVDKYWLKYDGHWNQQGSDLYADSLAVFIRSLSGAGETR